jgi:lipoyl(octanoyl) transferase
MFPPMRWRLLLTDPLDGATNMAIDEALMDRARERGETVFRVYTWSVPTLSLGRHQVAQGVYDRERAIRRGVDIVRRLTGGRAVLHHREVTYSAAGPVGNGRSLRETYDGINALLADALERLGAPVSLARPTNRMPPPASAPCFEMPASGEIEVEGRKLVGSALYRENGAYLQHGSILIGDDQPLVAELASYDVGRPAPAATLADVLGRLPTAREVADALFDSVRRSADAGATDLAFDEIRDAADRARTRYEDDAWTWRR